MCDNLQAKVEHPLRRGSFVTLHWNTQDNLLIMKRMWSDKQRCIDLAHSWMVTAPVFLLFICFSVYFLKASQTKMYLMLLTILASLSPQLLHCVACDLHRWNTPAVTTSFLMLYVVYTSKASDLSIKTSQATFPILVLIVLLNGTSTIRLFDGYEVQPFPFIEHQRYVWDLITEKKASPYIPEY